MRVLVEPMGPFAIGVEEEHHREPHPRGQCAFRVRVQFPWMRNPDCSLKVEVSAEEPLLAGSVNRALIHEFPGEALVAEMSCYRLEEIAAEKLRALLQSRRHLDEQGWLRNRPRDLFDLNYLWHQADYRVDWAAVAALLPAKAEAYEVHYDGPESFLDEQVLAGIEGDWQAQLANFVVDLPSFEQCRESLQAMLDAVFTAAS
nr:H347 [uncultured bacterium]